MADVTAAQRKLFAKTGVSMPDGSYYVRSGPLGTSDLQNAIDSVGRGADDSHNAIRMHIMKRAKALNLSNKIPDDWNSDGSLKHYDSEEFLEHFGIKGMKWGRRKASGSGPGPASEDSSRASQLHAKAKSGGGIHTLTNEELKTLNERLNLEQNYQRMMSAEGDKVKAGEKYVRDNLNRAKLVIDVAETGYKGYGIARKIHKDITK